MLNFKPAIHMTIVLGCCVSFLVGPLPLRADVKKSQPMKVQDVSLGNDGLLRGVLIDGQGQPVSNADVVVYFRNKPVVKTRSGKGGQFYARGLRAGFHTIQSKTAALHCRLWTSAAAPPSARQSAVLIKNEALVRGQWGMMYCIDPLQAVLAAGAVTGLVLALDYNDSEDNTSMPVLPPASP